MRNNGYIKQLLWVLLFAAGFGYVEAAVVVYLRGLYYPGGFDFPLKMLPDKTLLVEAVRELATILMILGAAAAAGKTRLERFAYFMYIFGVWDIVFYTVLKAVLNWPENFMTMDLLFFLPAAWTGPVLAPVIISVSLVTAGVFIVYFENNGYRFFQRRRLWAAEITGGAAVFASFILSAGDVAARLYPGHFYWPLFLAGELMGALPFAYAVYKTFKTKNTGRAGHGVQVR